MARRGRCKCGTILSFRFGTWGYKMRCPQCGANVRLRVRPPAPHRRHRAARKTASPAAPAPAIDVELWPVEIFTPSPLQRYGLWVALAAGLSLVAILAFIWFTYF